jgi:hypothetical protein
MINGSNIVAILKYFNIFNQAVRTFILFRNIIKYIMLIIASTLEIAARKKSLLTSLIFSLSAIVIKARDINTIKISNIGASTKFKHRFFTRRTEVIINPVRINDKSSTYIGLRNHF